MVSTAASSRASNAAPLASGSCLLYYCTLTNLLTLLLYIIISANIAFYIWKFLYFPQNSRQKLRPRNRALVRQPAGTAIDDLTTGWNRGWPKI